MNVAIIGRGIAGLNLAFRLYEKGHRITVFGETCQGKRASSAAQGLICNKGLLKGYHPLFQAKLRSLPYIKERLDRIEKVSGKRIRRNFKGVYEIYESPKDYSRIVKRVYKGKFTGIYKVENIPLNHGLSKFFPKGNGALFYSEDGWYSAEDLMSSIEGFLKRSGVDFVDEHISNIAFDVKDKPLLSYGWGGKSVPFDRLVLAAGAGTPVLLQKLRVNLTDFFYHPGQCLRFHSDLMNGFAFVNKTLSLIGQKSLTIGSTTGKVSSFENYDFDLAEGRANLIDFIDSKFGISNQTKDRIINAGFEDLWGTRLRLKNRQPVLGSLRSIEPKLQSVYLLTGFYKNGLQLADMFSEWLSEEMESGNPSSEAIPFHVSKL